MNIVDGLIENNDYRNYFINENNEINEQQENNTGAINSSNEVEEDIEQIAMLRRKRNKDKRR